MATEEPCQIKKEPHARVSQGDIFRDVHFIEDVIQTGSRLEVKRILFPLVIVLTQDCDLQSDSYVRWPGDNPPKNQDKRLISVLVAPLYNAAHFLEGSHLSDMGLTMQHIKKQSSGKVSAVEGNFDPRYHYLRFPPEARLANFVIDFKHYFSVNVEYLKKQKPTKYVCKVAELYREDLSQRFSSFLARIGLPEECVPLSPVY